MKTQLTKKPQISTPKIFFDAGLGELLIEGRSFPPDVTAFYQDVLDWLDEYSQNPAKKTVMTLKLDYFNTASSKIIMDILYKMEELKTSNNDVVVEWFYPDDDEDMLETGREYEELVDVPFEQIKYTYKVN